MIYGLLLAQTLWWSWPEEESNYLPLSLGAQEKDPKIYLPPRHEAALCALSQYEF